MAKRTECACGSGEYPDELYDGRGIFCCYYCPKCEREKVAQYRPEVLAGAYDADEPIEEC